MDAKDTTIKTWKEKANEYARFQNGGSLGSGIIQESYRAGITDYKKSLREAMEKRIKANEENRDKELEGTIAYWAGELIVEESKQYLKMIDLVTPLNS